MADLDAVVVGAGVVGLAIGAALARSGRETLILDGERIFGSWTSSRNSEVIHAGIYYSGHPLKQALCVRGRELLYRYCEARSVPFRRIGKVIFAADASQSADLDRIDAHARAAGVSDLRRLTAREARTVEPELDCAEALLSPSTGIIDSHGYMTALLADAEAGGAQFVGLTTVRGLSRNADGEWRVRIGETSEEDVTARIVVNAAGLAAHRLAAATEGLSAEHVPEIRYARGNYFSYAGRLPFSHLVYPVPVPGGLGTHLTFDIAGAGRFGPDVEWIGEIEYGVDPARASSFAEAARKIWPRIDPDKLMPAYSGIRAKLSGPGAPARDFLIEGEEAHGLPGLVNLFGIESPGLTSSLAIAELVLDKLGIPHPGDLARS